MRRATRKRVIHRLCGPQDSGSLHHDEPGIVSVNAYGVLNPVTFPLAVARYKPKIGLKPGDVFQTKPGRALDLLQHLLAVDLHVDDVLADTV